jgi:L-ascorbate metabolism protein UlaG (beta-lactamase superfamily)
MSQALHLTSVLLCISMLAGCVSHQSGSPRLAPASLEPRSAAIPSGTLTVTYFGTTTLLLSDGTHALMTDGFFSHPSGPLRLLLGQVKPNEERIDAALKYGAAPPKIDALFVVHSHHDHALDSAVVALKTNAQLLGSDSVRNIALGQLSPEEFPRLRFSQIEIDRRHAVGSSFMVQAFEAKHSPGRLFVGEVTKPLAMPAHISRFKMGKVYSFAVHHQQGTVLLCSGSAIKPGQFNEVRADVVFFSIGGLHHRDAELVRSMWRDCVRATKAKVVIPVHWDDFTAPLDSPLTVMPKLFGDFDAVMEQLLDLGKEEPHVKVRLLPPFEPFVVRALAD